VWKCGKIGGKLFAELELRSNSIVKRTDAEEIQLVKDIISGIEINNQ